ncbi:PREDICTED: uncharacterized protein LOC102853500 [Elephantulus edwardii]|uniref:uncharacterized protein LOC102853500 n=1 Tax=Elephantulus edwardii TaxID=28737 RepID=UPI0003F06076|nr:PREDICTED: uncharacterized protein LOC102853500 [Elephantulus edwardii]
MSSLTHVASRCVSSHARAASGHHPPAQVAGGQPSSCVRATGRHASSCVQAASGCECVPSPSMDGQQAHAISHTGSQQMCAIPPTRAAAGRVSSSMCKPSPKHHLPHRWLAVMFHLACGRPVSTRFPCRCHLGSKNSPQNQSTLPQCGSSAAPDFNQVIGHPFYQRQPALPPYPFLRHTFVVYGSRLVHAQYEAKKPSPLYKKKIALRSSTSSRFVLVIPALAMSTGRFANRHMPIQQLTYHLQCIPNTIAMQNRIMMNLRMIEYKLAELEYCLSTRLFNGANH